MIYCENIVDKTLFFLLFPIFRNHFFFSFFSPIFGNAIATIAKKKFYSPILAMALPQLGSHKFFFLPISAMALPQLVCHKNFFFSYLGNAIATNLFHFFFSRNDTCRQFLQQILSVRLLLLD